MSAVTVRCCLERALPRLELQLWHPGNVNLERALGEDPFFFLAIAGAQLAMVLCRVCHCFVTALWDLCNWSESLVGLSPCLSPT